MDLSEFLWEINIFYVAVREFGFTEQGATQCLGSRYDRFDVLVKQVVAVG